MFITWLLAKTFIERYLIKHKDNFTFIFNLA